MKISRTITIEAEVWTEAQKKTDNLSGTLNDLLKNWVTTVKDKDMNDIEKTKIELKEKQLKIASMEKKIAEFEAIEKKRKPVLILGGNK